MIKSKILIPIKYKEAAGVDKGREIYRKYINKASKGTFSPNKVSSGISGAKNPIDTDFLRLFSGFRDFKSLILDSDRELISIETALLILLLATF